MAGISRDRVLANSEGKKRVLIAMDTLMCGGIEKAAVSMLSAFSPERYDVTLLVLTKTGEFLDLVPSWVKVVEVPLSPGGRDEWVRGRRVVLQKALVKGRWLCAARLLARQVYCWACVPKARWPAVHFSAILRGAELGAEEYDCAMAYHNIEQAVLVAERIRARKKMTWFHTELSKLPVSPRAYSSIYKQFDVFAAVSEAVAKELRNIFPEYADRVAVFPHVMNGAVFQSLAKQGPGFEDGYCGLRVLSVGRLAAQKGFDLAVRIHARLLQDGVRHRWYVVGQGPEEASLRQLIRELHVEESFILLGVRKNPYPFFAECDVYVQPSRYEGYCLTVAEARAFCKPIVCTDFAGAREQIRDAETGLIVPCEEPALESALGRLLVSAELRRQFAKALSLSSVDTTSEASRLYAVFDS